MYGWHEVNPGFRWQVSGSRHEDYRHRVWLSCDISFRREFGCPIRKSSGFLL